MDGYTIPPATTWLLFSLQLLLSLLAISTNCLVWTFYLRKHTNITHYLYLISSLFDCTCGVTPLLHAALLTQLSGADYNPHLLASAYFLTSLASRVSVVLSMVIAVVRTLAIALPFYSPNRRVLTGAVVAYGLLWCVFLTGDVVYFYNELANARIPFITKQLFKMTLLFFVAPGFHFTETLLGEEGEVGRWQLILNYSVTLALPVAVSLICVVVQVVHLLKKRSSTGQGSAGRGRNARITTTILQLTMVTVTCYTVSSIMTLIVTKEGSMEEWEIVTNYCCVNCMPFLNGVLYPVILIVRGRELNRHVRRIGGMVALDNRAATTTDGNEGSVK